MTDPHSSIILNFVARVLMIPFIILYGFYVLAHGESSPGGGFQAGAILAAAVILSRLSLGREQHVVSTRGLIGLAVAGLLLYAGTGLVPLFFGGEYLDYGRLPLPHQDGIVFGHVTVRSVGVFLIEAGVTMGVLGVLGTMFDYLTGADWRDGDAG